MNKIIEYIKSFFRSKEPVKEETSTVYNGMTYNLMIDEKLFDIVHDSVPRARLHYPDLNNDENWEKYCKSVQDHKGSFNGPSVEEQLTDEHKNIFITRDTHRVVLRRMN